MNIPKLPLRKYTIGKEEADTYGLLAGLGYLLILFFVPLVACPDSKLGKKCANQGLTLLAIAVVFGILKVLLGWIPILGFLVNIICVLVVVADIAFALYAFYMLKVNRVAIELPYFLNLFH